MNRMDRLTGMILLLQGRRCLTAEDIATHFEISVRTAYRDMVALGEAGVPIVAEAGVGYSLARGYHMPPVMFTEEEAAALVIGAEATRQVANDSLKRSIGGALLKIRSVLPADRRDYVTRLESAVNVHFGPERPSHEGGNVMPLQQAIVRRRCVELHYHTGGQGPLNQRVVEPLGMVFYARHWHLIAWCRLRRDLRDFRLDRMTHWRVLTERFSGHEDFSLTEFIARSMEGCGKMTPVCLLADRRILERLRAGAPSSLLREHHLPDGRVRLEILTPAADYLAHWLLGFGALVEVESPPALRDSVRAAARDVVALYQKEFSGS